MAKDNVLRIPHTREKGDTGSFFSWGYNQEEYSADLDHQSWLGDAVTLGEIYEMRNDPQVHMTELAVKNPIKSATWDVKAASDSTPHKEQAEFIRDQLFQNQNWSQILENLMQGPFFGAAVMEKVYRYNPLTKKIELWKLAPRKLRTIERWVFKGGHLAELVQRAYANDTIIEASIPVRKCLIFTYQREGDDWLGRSILRIARKPWVFKKHLQNIDNIAIERSPGFPVMYQTESNVDQRDIANIKAALPKIAAHQQAYMFVPWGFKFEFTGMSEKDRIDPIDRIIYADVQITRAIMADFLNLGTSGGAGQTSHGSFALSTNKSKIYLLALQTLAKQICDLFNIGEPRVFPSMIKELIDLNFPDADGKYPRLCCSNLSAKDVESIKASAEVLKILDEVPSVDNEDKNWFRRHMEVPEINPRDSSDMPKEEEKPDKPASMADDNGEDT